MAHIAGQYYHVFNRGCNRARIFNEGENYLYLLRLIKAALADIPVRMIAYCLMPNHYHFLLRCDTDRAVGLFTQRLFNTYTQAFNRRYQRSGTLFEGRSKSILVSEERYALHLCRYIHLNPVVAGLVKAPEGWPYSNYLEWVGKRIGTLVDHEFISLYYQNPKEYRAFIDESIEEALENKLTKYYFD